MTSIGSIVFSTFYLKHRTLSLFRTIDLQVFYLVTSLSKSYNPTAVVEMTPVPDPSPARGAPPRLPKRPTNAWKFFVKVMKWFSKLVTTSYTWTDLIIHNRQRNVDNAYNIKTAEVKAAEIINTKQEKEGGQKRGLKTRGFERGGGSDAGRRV